MKRALLIIALLLAWAPGAALASWDARKSEAMSLLASATVTEEEKVALKQALETYFGGREDCFEGLIAIVAKTDESEQQPTFRDRVGVCSVGATQVLSRALQSIKEPSKAALELLNVLSTQEAAFYQNLGSVSVAGARDRIVVIRIHLAEMTKVLDGKWRALLDEDATLDDRAKQMAPQIRADYDAIIKMAAETNRDAAETIADIVKRWLDAGSPSPGTGNDNIDQGIAVVKGVLQVAIAQWQSMHTRVYRRLDTYHALFSSERRVLVMFKDVREDVKEFLEDNDFPKADAAYAAAKGSLDTFASSAKTSGQSSDAAELRDDLMEKLTAHRKEAADVYATFVARHQEKFFGALGPDIQRELVEHEDWDRYASSIDRYALDAKLRDWHTKATNLFEVDLSHLSNDARERLKTGLRAVLEDLVEEYETAEKDYRQLKTETRDERKQVEDELR